MRDFQGRWENADDPQDGMAVQFYADIAIDKEATEAARQEDPGALPVWKDVARAIIRSRNDQKSEWDKLIDGPEGERLKMQFGKAWASFEHGALGEIVGTPLQEWGAIPRSVVKGLNQQGLVSVEDVAGVPDAQLAVLGKGGSALRESARVFLKPKDKAIVGLEKDNEDLRSKLQELEARMEQMLNMPAVEPEGGKRRGRPPMNKAMEA